MSPSALIVVGVLTPLSGIVGSLLWPIIQRKCQWSSLKVLVTLVIMASLLPAYGCLGFIIPSRVGFGGLTTQGEMFALAIYFGEWNVTHRSFGWPKLARYMKGRSMVHSKVMQELSTPNYFLLAKKRVGMDSIQSQTRQVFFMSPMIRHHSCLVQSSSFIGPLVVGLISDLTGNIRFAFFFLVIMIWAAVPLLMDIDTDRGWKDAQDYSIQIHPDE